MIRTRRARMLYKLLWLIKEDWKSNFIDNARHATKIYFVNAGKNIKWIDMYNQLIRDYKNLMENGITDNMFSD